MVIFRSTDNTIVFNASQAIRDDPHQACINHGDEDPTTCLAAHGVSNAFGMNENATAVTEEEMLAMSGRSAEG
ncbi:hypothetical protein ColLi_07332 [Colletotrichum liriopes]|uniref:Uncharacterized protein n=1 Tax=Colletotrichum liriopes TaxID=708192 RepID=A0AA37GNV6_9PEZI|nr:hypothetical protein ColLi_07332 [Colletotrichum liriopes]